MNRIVYRIGMLNTVWFDVFVVAYQWKFSVTFFGESYFGAIATFIVPFIVYTHFVFSVNKSFD